jgi:hypothetical protein
LGPAAFAAASSMTRVNPARWIGSTHALSTRRFVVESASGFHASALGIPM